MKLGDLVRIAPELTHQPTWISGKVIDVEDNPFVGLVIRTQTEDGNIFFGRADCFAPQVHQ